MLELACVCYYYYDPRQKTSFFIVRAWLLVLYNIILFIYALFNHENMCFLTMENNILYSNNGDIILCPGMLQ